MNFVPYAVPVFLVLIVLEFCWGWFKGNNTYRLNDSLNSLSLGLLSVATKFIFLSVGYIVFVKIERDYSLGLFDSQITGHWLIALLVYDFFYYWFHRISHERQFFWGSHVVHHQSEDYNLSTALRQTSTSFFTTWIFYVPCFVLGMPIGMYISIASAHLIYQFWVHSQHIPKLGVFEWFLITPSNHRVHHAQNEQYIDKNYGGLFIIWDRLFGTFKEEDEQEAPIYGIRTPLQSWNPAWANIHIFVTMLSDAWRTQLWRDKLRILWAKTDWRPEDMEAQYPQPKTNLEQFEKYNPQLSTVSNIVIIAQYLMVSVLHFWTSLQLLDGPYWLVFGATIIQIITLVAIGMVLDGGRYVRLMEVTRSLVTLVIVYNLFELGLISSAWLNMGLLYFCVSGALMWFVILREASNQSELAHGLRI